MTRPTPAIPADNRILYFRRDRETFGFLSHFHPAPIELDGETWSTVEHFYQAQKSFDPEYWQAIRSAASPSKAKRLANTVSRPRWLAKQSWFTRHGVSPRPDWPDAKLEIMRRADLAKYTQHADLTAALLATEDAELIEDSLGEPFWGIGRDGQGLNWAGRVLMEVRERLRLADTS